MATDAGHSGSPAVEQNGTHQEDHHPSLEQQVTAEWEHLLQAVDGDYAKRSKESQPIITWKSSNFPVKDAFRLPIAIDLGGTVVDYRFNTLENDIEFSVHFTTMEGDQQVTEIVVEPRRLDSHIEPIMGTFNMAKPGKLLLIWNNDYSWFAIKTLAYSITLHVPSVVATEALKCERALRALHTCQAQAEAERQQRMRIAKGRAEAAGNAQALEEEIQQLQRRLEQERHLLRKLEKEDVWLATREAVAVTQAPGLLFRTLMMHTLQHILSYASPEDRPDLVCRDWKEAIARPVRRAGSRMASKQPREVAA